jgi:hypothetical protein
VTGVTSGSLGAALRAGLIAGAQAVAFYVVGGDPTIIRARWVTGPVYAVVPLPNAQAAMAYSTSMIGQPFGPYDLATNSCVSWCGSVLASGGITNLPQTSVELLKFLRQYRPKEVRMESESNFELVDPQGLGVRSQLMTILQHALRRDTYVGLDTIAVVCEAIAVDARFNMWFFANKEKIATEEQFMELLLKYEKLRNLTSAAVQKFHEDHKKSNLQRVIQDIAVEMNEMMKTEFRNSFPE